MPIVSPIPGDIVHLFRRKNADAAVQGPLAAIITGVMHDRQINVTKLNYDGSTEPLQNVMLLHEGDTLDPVDVLWAEQIKR